MTKLKVFHQTWCDSLPKHKEVLILAQTNYFSRIICLNKNKLKYLFDGNAHMAMLTQLPVAPAIHLKDRMQFLTQKIQLIMDTVPKTQPIAAVNGVKRGIKADKWRTVLAHFTKVSLENLTQLANGAKEITRLVDLVNYVKNCLRF